MSPDAHHVDTTVTQLTTRNPKSDVVGVLSPSPLYRISPSEDQAGPSTFYLIPIKGEHPHMDMLEMGSDSPLTPSHSFFAGVAETVGELGLVRSIEVLDKHHVSQATVW